MSRRRFLMPRNGIPAGYREAVCLIGDGKAHISIPKVDTTKHPVVSFAFLDNGSFTEDRNVFGCITGTGERLEFGIGWDNTCFSANYGNGYQVVWPKSSSFWNKKVDVTMQYPNNVAINETAAELNQYAVGKTGILTDVWLFGTNRGELKRYYTGEIYRFSIEGQYDMIPVLDPNGTACMYDLVGKKPYYNASPDGQFFCREKE